MYTTSAPIQVSAMQGIIPFPKYPSTRKWNMIDWHRFRMLEGDLWQHWPNYFGIHIWESYLYFLSRRYGQNFASWHPHKVTAFAKNIHDISRTSSSKWRFWDHKRCLIKTCRYQYCSGFNDSYWKSVLRMACDRITCIVLSCIVNYQILNHMLYHDLKYERYNPLTPYFLHEVNIEHSTWLPGWWQGQLINWASLERIRPASLGFGTSANPGVWRQKTSPSVGKQLSSPFSVGWGEGKTKGKHWKKNECHWMMDGSGIIDYIDWLEKSMMFIVRWLYSSRDHSSLDLVVIPKYTIDFPKPCKTEEQAFSAQAERGHVGGKL